MRVLIRLLRSSPLVWYFVLAYAASGLALVVIGLPRLDGSGGRPPLFLAMFPVIVIAAGLAGIGMTAATEEIGWTGFAYPRLRARLGALGGALLLGVLWAVWHLPVVDSMGAASPHGASWPTFFAAFSAVVVAIRVLIAWLYANTGSVLGAQLVHASSTGFLVVLSAPGVSPSEEALWYFVYAAVLWLTVCLVLARYGANLIGAPRRGKSTTTDGRGPLDAAATA